MARSTISIDDDLKARMDALTERVNWSAIAAEAFEKRLNEIDSKKRGLDMSAVIQRLKASKALAQSNDYELGRADGHSWAAQHAAYDELVRLKTFIDQLDEEWFLYTENPPKALADVITDEEENWQEFWADLVTENDTALLDKPRYLEGFAMAAVELFEQVEDQL